MLNKDVRIAICYPPIPSSKGVPLLSQNRQFQYFNSPTYIYPMVPAYAATLLKTNKYKVDWMDGIAENISYENWLNQLIENDPDFLLIETKSPVIKKHWEIINEIKKSIDHTKIVLVGDHVTAFPYESFENSEVDYIICGGDYDFLILNLLNHISKGTPLEGGIYWRKNDNLIKSKTKDTFTMQNGSKIYNSGLLALRHNLDELPFIDRDLTKWKLYAYKNGNYKYFPATYMYSGRDCWWNKCTFCIWDHTLNPIGTYRSFSAKRLFDEVKYIVDKYKVKEIFDDAGTMFVGPKLKQFCELMISSGYNKKVKYGCNMRFNALTKEYYLLMKQAGFRFILYGMESGNQKTLDILNKGIKVEDIVSGSKMASEAGLDVHATIMLGYPWESYIEAQNTIRLAKDCFNKAYFNTMQATIVIPYPGTPLWKQCKTNNWLTNNEYEDYDMRKPVMKIPFTKEQLMDLVQELYSAFFTYKYVFRKILQVRNWADVNFLFSAGIKLTGHLLDFDMSQNKKDLYSISFHTKTFKRFLKNMLN